MSLSFLAAAAAALAAAVVTGMLVRRCARMPRLDLIAWVLAAAGLTIALAAQALGYHQGFNPTSFRLVEVGARLAAPLALVWGLAELTGRTFWARFGSRLALGALTVITGVILAADPLSGVTFTTAWPSASAHYQLIPNLALVVLAVVTALAALIALIVAGVRAQRQPGWRGLFPAVLAAALAALLTEGLQVTLPIKPAYPALCLIAAVLTWYAGQRSAVVQLAALHDAAGPGEDTGSWDSRHADDTGYSRYRPDTGGFGRVSTDSDYSGLYRDESGTFGRVGSDTDLGRLYQDTGGFGAVGSDTGYGFYRTDTDLGPPIGSDPDRHGGPAPGIVETGDILPVAFDVFTPAASGGGGEETERLYGQIAIYTLIDGQSEEFDQLAHQVVEKVKALEPGTLAYIVHGVPSAPLQRILYEVYRDGAAFEEHGHQPYIQDFEEERKPFVLATNVIELGVRQAKMSPLTGPDVLAGPGGRPGPPASGPRGWSGNGPQGRSAGDGRLAPPGGPGERRRSNGSR
ncbi:MAG TPA: antibiotic biosynthesis monooxygenase [Streptosporangiaceae bacterium]|nr:antibiotic biosynthesis monooxygenase [Streptosporangiaceae bacterium]